MSSVMISSRSHTPGASVASAAAERLGFELLDDSLYRLASERFSVPEADLRRAFEERPSLWGMSDVRRRGLATCMQATLTARLLQDRVVYHGPFSRLLVRGVAHIVQVRIASSPDSRAAAAEQAGVPHSRAAKRVRMRDEDADRIAEAVFGARDGDEDYDLVFDLSCTPIDAAADAIALAASADKHRPTSYSRMCLEELELSHRLAAQLSQEFHVDLRVVVVQGSVNIRALAPDRKRKRIQARAESLARELDGVSNLDVQVVPDRLRPLPAGLR